MHSHSPCHTYLPVLLLAGGLAAVPACSSKEEDGALGSRCDPNAPLCESDLTCAPTTDSAYRCFGRVVLRGEVTSTETGATVPSAHVIALDEEGSAVTDVAISTEEGSYLLDLPVMRNEDGTPVDATFTLHTAAQDFQPFPQGVRVALPISTEDAEKEGTLYVVENALTNVGLIPLSDDVRTLATGSVLGLTDESLIAGVLVVATGEAGSFSAISDLSGQFTIFNLVPGEYEVRAYGAGIQVSSETITVSDEPIEGVELAERDEPTTDVSGNVQIVNAPGGSVTSVILVVEDTFDATMARGEVPRGLRAPESGPVSIDGDFTIEDVPEGSYVVLAAYENDDLVRDPDTNIAGTTFVTIDVTAGDDDISLEDSFKITEALAIIQPGADGPEEVSSAPTLEWADDSSEDWYDLQVYDAFGNQVYEVLEIPGVSGSSTVTHEYEGPLETGMYYQFRVSSWRQPGKGDPAPISTTEDLKGVFFLAEE